DVRPMRFMTEHRASYPALADESTFDAIAAMERRLDGTPRMVVPAGRIGAVSDGIETGDVLAFATRIPGLDVTHAAFAFRDDRNILRVLHAPLSGGVVEITRSTLPEYVAAIRSCTGILVARQLAGPAAWASGGPARRCLAGIDLVFLAAHADCPVLRLDAFAPPRGPDLGQRRAKEHDDRRVVDPEQQHRQRPRRPVRL